MDYCFTLPIFDERGEITGKQFSVLVSSRRLILRHDDLNLLTTGEAIPVDESGIETPPHIDTIWLNGMSFKKDLVTNGYGTAFYVWIRKE